MNLKNTPSFSISYSPQSHSMYLVKPLVFHVSYILITQTYYLHLKQGPAILNKSSPRVTFADDLHLGQKEDRIQSL